MNTSISLLAVVILFATVNSVYAETSIYAVNEENSISVTWEDDLGFISYNNSQGPSEHWPVSKFFNSGGFVMISPEINVWGHFLDDDQYDLTVQTYEGIEKFTTQALLNVPDKEKIIGEETNNILKEYWENRLGQIPDDSLGADISKWDIPSEGRSDYEYVTPGKEFDPDTLDMIVSNPNSVQYKHTFSFDVIAINNEIASKKDQRIQDVTISAKITNPIDELVQYWSGVTDKYGKFEGAFFVPDNTMLGLYTLEIVADLERYTTNTKSIPFYVTPQDKDGLSGCPTGYMRNSTSLICQIECENGYKINYTKNICEVVP